MKKWNNYTFLRTAVLILSVAAYLLRRRLYAAALDEKGLLIVHHPLGLLLWAVILAGAVLILLTVRKLDGNHVYEDNFSPSNTAALGHLLMGCTALMMTLLSDFPLPDPVGRIWKALGMMTAAAMVWAGFCRTKGKKPFFGVHAALCLFLLLYLVSRYQGWSGNPQLQDYVFELLALVFLTLFSYQYATFEVGIGNRRMLLATGLLTVLLCGAANFRAQLPALYFSALVWAAADLCHLDPPPKKDEVDAHEAT